MDPREKWLLSRERLEEFRELLKVWEHKQVLELIEDNLDEMDNS